MTSSSVLVIVLSILALLLLGSSWFWKIILRLVFIQPNLTIEELPYIFAGQKLFKINRNPTKMMPGADKSVQVCNDEDGVSIIYHTTKRKDGLIETVDIAYTGKFGMIFTLFSDRVTFFQRIGGSSRSNPELTGEEENALLLFMIPLRKLVEKP